MSHHIPKVHGTVLNRNGNVRLLQGRLTMLNTTLINSAATEAHYVVAVIVAPEY